LAQVLPLVDVLMPNDQEALHISGKTKISEAVSYLTGLGIPVIAVKRGIEGALVRGKGESHRCAVEPAAAGGDSVGAGDSFDAGFLAGWLRGFPLAQCLEIACACGRSVACAAGGLLGQPTWDALSRRLGL
jgi:sugar/nucleoside kinase (ribokinase family)